jgi:hypothetical protein
VARTSDKRNHALVAGLTGAGLAVRGRPFFSPPAGKVSLGLIFSTFFGFGLFSS